MGLRRAVVPGALAVVCVVVAVRGHYVLAALLAIGLGLTSGFYLWGLARHRTRGLVVFRDMNRQIAVQATGLAALALIVAVLLFLGDGLPQSYARGVFALLAALMFVVGAAKAWRA